MFLDAFLHTGGNARLGFRAKEGRDSEDDFGCGCHLESLSEASTFSHKLNTDTKNDGFWANYNDQPAKGIPPNGGEQYGNPPKMPFIQVYRN